MKSRSRKVMIPEFVFHKNYQLWMNKADKLLCIPLGVKWQVTNKIGMGIAFCHLVPGGWKKTYQDLMLLILLFQRFNHRFALFKLACRWAMNPNNSVAGRNFWSEFLKRIFSAFSPLPCFFLPQWCDADTCVIKPDKYIVKKEQPASLSGKSNPGAPNYISLFLPTL